MDATAAQLLNLLDTSGTRLHALLAKLTGNRDAADELLQDLFVKLFKSSRFADAPHPEAYMFRSAINLAFDWRKKQHQSADISLPHHDVAADEIPPSERIAQMEATERVLAAMERLSESDRELITLRFIQDESNEWIAGRLNSTPHQIRSRCSKAVARLRSLVETKLEGLT